MSAKKKTIEGWKKEFGWLKVESLDDKICISCDLCKKNASRLQHLRNFSRAFIDGTHEKLKKDTVVKHAQSEQHKRALQIDQPSPNVLEYVKTPLGKSFTKGESEEKSRLVKLFDISYMMAKEEIPFAKFVPLVNLEIRHGVSLGETYISDRKASEFVQFIAMYLKEKVEKSVRNSDYFSILIDGSTDTSHTEKELMFLKVIENGVSKTFFFQITSLGGGKAVDIRDHIEKSLKDFNFENKLVGFCSDGASVNLGRKGGVSTLLSTTHPWIVTIHCLNHRLELAAKDAFKGTYFDKVTDILFALHNFYKRSPKRIRELKLLSEIMDEQVKIPQKANGTRWVQHKRRACETLVESYPVFVSHLENIAEDEDTKSDDKARVKGYLKTMKCVKFAVHMLLFKQILQSLSKFSLSLQKESAADLLSVPSLLEKTYSQLTKLKKKFSELPATPELKVSQENQDKDIRDEIHKLFAAVDQQADVCYKDIKLSKNMTSAQSTELIPYLDRIEKCLMDRFGDLHKDPIFDCFKLIDTNLWPEKSIDLESFGNKLLRDFIDHFSKLLEKNRCDETLMFEEWQEVKIFVNRNLRHLSPSEVWSLLMLKHHDQYSNILHMIKILYVLPSSNAIVERGFSTMLRVKSDSRNKLGDDTLNDLMIIDLEGPDPGNFDCGPCVDLFMAAKSRRPNVQPYGPRPGPSKRPAEESVMSLETESEDIADEMVSE